MRSTWATITAHRAAMCRVHPLSFAEYYSAVGGDKQDAFDEFAFYGGMPLILSRPTSWTWIDHPVSGLLVLTHRPVKTRCRFGSVP